MTERWKPESGEWYWYVGSDIVPYEDQWENFYLDGDYYESGNCFRTEEETKAAAEKVKALLLSLHEPEDGNSQKTPISESLQQEDCKKHGFLQPSHYNITPEPIDVIKSWGLNFCLGNVIEHIARSGKKDGESRDSDLHKAMSYLRMELEDEG